MLRRFVTIKTRRGFTLPIVYLLLPAVFCLLPTAYCRLPDAKAGGISTETREGRLAVFDDVWETIHERYYDPAFHGVDWQAQRDMFRPLAAEATSAAKLYSILRSMIGSLRDAHTRVRTPDEKFDWRNPRAISVGLSVREVEGAAIVVAVERESEAERLGLRAGDAIVSIDDEAAQDVFRRRLREQGGSSTAAAARLRAMGTLFDGPRGSPVRIVWRNGEGAEKTCSLRREWRERSAAVRVRELPGGNALVEFDVFAPDTALEFTRTAMSKLRGARGIVLDLRNNGGGDAEAMIEIASSFLPVGKSLGRFTDRTGRASFEAQTRSALLLSADSITRLQAPVVVLAGERTSSAAEIFAHALKEARRARIIGQNTCGCVLAIRRRHTLPDGGELDVSEMDYRTSTGARLEGVGVVPDEMITLRKTDLLARRDRALERALAYLASESRQR
jgi:carboxyl-terminal processing protease